MNRSKGLLIKYGTFTLFLIIGIIMFFIGLLNGMSGKEDNVVFSMIFMSGFILSGGAILFIFVSLIEDF